MRRKVRRRSSSNSLNVVRDFKSDNVRRFHSIRNKNRKQLVNRSKNDPMQLEFVINRLANKQSLLGKGRLVNHAKLDMKMGEAFEQSKKYHLQLQAWHRIELEMTERKLMDSQSNRNNIHRQVINELSRKAAMQPKPHANHDAAAAANSMQADENHNNNGNKARAVGMAHVLSSIKDQRRQQLLMKQNAGNNSSSV